ncbi:MAG: hypothetical protein JWP97_2221 [Labilithrix sp.]|nr:hypothetical protein [Labilithrix sp.]
MNGSSLRSLLATLALTGIVATLPSCSDGFGRVKGGPHLAVTLAAGTNTGSPVAPRTLQVGTPVPFRAKVTAYDANNQVDSTFNRYVRISAKPGAVSSFTGDDVEGRNVLLRNGESVEFEVSLLNAYGTAYLVADDLGYVPADPLRDPPPSCSNGIDDDGDGVIDFPADTGCAFANDDSEESGTYSEGISAPIFFALPRIADVRGLLCDPMLGCSGNGRTPFPREQVQLATGYNEATTTYAYDTIVTRLSSDGFYVTDLGDKRGGFNSVFSFNFNAPPRMRVCDRMKTFGGTPSEFFGFTQISYPTWTLEEWDPARRPCLVPAPERLTPSVITDTTQLLVRTANLLRVETTPDGAQKVRVTPHFGPADVAKTASGAYVATNDASNCDFDHNGKINSFVKGEPEGDCSTACTADPECTEYSNYLARSTFRLTVTDSNNRSAAIQADASASASFDALALKGVTLRSFTGTMSFFSGGAQYTLEARCNDDIVLDLKSGPFLEDFACQTDADCTTDRGLPKAFTCTQLSDPRGGKACRRVLPPAVEGGLPSYDPPPLACVFPRTIAEQNPQ